MVHIEQRPLGSLEQHRPPFADFLVEETSRIGKIGKDARGQRQISVGHFGGRVELGVRNGSREPFFLDKFTTLGAEALRVGQVTEPQPPAAHLILVGRADSFGCGPDLPLSPGPFAGLLHGAMVGQDHMRMVADPQPVARLEACLAQGIQLFDKRFRVKDHSRAQYGGLFRTQHSAGEQLKDQLFVFMDYGMPGVGATLVARNDIEKLGEDIDDLALAFVSPLCAD